ncbi:hypothetical protein [Bartonella bacilliformis]|nr:hypothetical protein [Bartonella bacilliformis]
MNMSAVLNFMEFLVQEFVGVEEKVASVVIEHLPNLSSWGMDAVLTIL